MPKLKKQHHLSIIDRRKMLQTVAARVKVEAEEAESIASAARQREQVLTDICRYMEQLLSRGVKHSNSKASSNSRAEGRTEARMHAAQQAPAQGVASTPCTAGQHQQVEPPASSCRPSVMTSQERLQHQQQLLQQPGNNIQPAGTLRGSSCSSARCPLQQQQPMSSAAPGASKSQAAAGCVAWLPPPGDPSHPEHMLHLPSLSPHVAAVLSSVPPYCCMTGLLQTISHELLSAAAALTAQDWMNMLAPAVYELAMLLELSNREDHRVAEPVQQPQQQQPQQPLCSPRQAQSCDHSHSSNSHDSSEGGLSSFDSPHRVDHAGACGEQQPPAAAAAVQPPQRQGVAAAAAAPAAVAEAACSGHAEMQRIADGALGIATVTAALSPTHIFQALSVNHREPMDQQTQPAPPWGHWQSVVRRLGLSKAQAAYISACTDQVVMLVKEQCDALHRLTGLAGGHSLLFMAAEPPLEQLEQQQLEEEQQAEWQDLLRLEQRVEKVQGDLFGDSTRNTSHAHHQLQQQQKLQEANLVAAHSREVEPPAAADAAAAAAAGEGGAADAADALVTAMSTRTSQMALWGALLMLLILDTLATEQKAKLLVATYPWGPASIPVGLCAGELLLPENQHHLQPGTLQQQQRQEHQQQHRQQWWLEVLQEMPLTDEEVGVVAAAAGISASDMDTVMADRGIAADKPGA